MSTQSQCGQQGAVVPRAAHAAQPEVKGHTVCVYVTFLLHLSALAGENSSFLYAVKVKIQLWAVFSP